MIAVTGLALGYSLATLTSFYWMSLIQPKRGAKWNASGTKDRHSILKQQPSLGHVRSQWDDFYIRSIGLFGYLAADRYFFLEERRKMAEALAIYESKRGKTIPIVYVRRHVIVPFRHPAGLELGRSSALQYISATFSNDGM